MWIILIHLGLWPHSCPSPSCLGLGVGFRVSAMAQTILGMIQFPTIGRVNGVGWGQAAETWPTAGVC